MFQRSNSVSHFGLLGLSLRQLLLIFMKNFFELLVSLDHLPVLLFIMLRLLLNFRVAESAGVSGVWRVWSAVFLSAKSHALTAHIFLIGALIMSLNG